jgi:hypothetical protein
MYLVFVLSILSEEILFIPPLSAFPVIAEASDDNWQPRPLKALHKFLDAQVLWAHISFIWAPENMRPWASSANMRSFHSTE